MTRLKVVRVLMGLMLLAKPKLLPFGVQIAAQLADSGFGLVRGLPLFVHTRFLKAFSMY